MFLIGVYYLSKKDINQPRFCGETDITLDYGNLTSLIFIYYQNNNP